ncbi:hypothetical protein SEA_ABBA_47 [Arthrobacter phage Abba]|uniref:Uncharacterized protein n=1 Tax=Arthrobacter phage Abba TaxID=2713256 RepID=A0A6G8R2H1_9CAUD|nr:hypothetical protein HYQ28_gp47 [Arthrobacter phage Abba]QIN94376.1 hypothetical protein SEA_ABBA_47 [Arthrobacter phage Abba]
MNRMNAGDEPMTQLVGFTVVEFNQAGGAPYLVDGLTELLDDRAEAEGQIELYKERQAYGRRRDRWQVAAVYIEPEEAES